MHLFIYSMHVFKSLGDGESTCMTSLLCLAGLLRAKTLQDWSFHFNFLFSGEGYLSKKKIVNEKLYISFFAFNFPIFDLHLFDVNGNNGQSNANKCNFGVPKQCFER